MDLHSEQNIFIGNKPMRENNFFSSFKMTLKIHFFRNQDQ
jgi:hypothetical protein